MDDNEANIIRRINQHRLSVDGIYGAITRRSSARASVSSQGSAYDLDERLKDFNNSSPIGDNDNPFGEENHHHQQASLNRTNSLGITEYDRLKLEAKYNSALPLEIPYNSTVSTTPLTQISQNSHSNILPLAPSRQESNYSTHTTSTITNRGNHGAVAGSLNLRRMSGLSFADEDMTNLDELDIGNLQDVEEEVEDLTDDEVEPDVQIQIDELTNEDIEHTWEGMLDTAVPASSLPPDAKPVSNMVSDGILELANSLSYVEGKKGDLDQNTKEDVSSFIKQLSEKLVDNNENYQDQFEDPAIQAANDKKLALLREEASRMEQLREEQAKQRREKKLRAIHEEEMDSLHLPENEMNLDISEPDSPDTEEENELNLVPGVSEQQTIQEEEVNKTDEQKEADKEKKKKKYRTPEEQRRREMEKAERAKRREEKRKLREQKRKEREQRERERKSSSARRRKTSSKKLSRLKLSENLSDIPVHTG